MLSQRFVPVLQATARGTLRSCQCYFWLLISLMVTFSTLTPPQAVYVTAILPYVVLGIFLVRGLTLKGAMSGLQFLFVPDVCFKVKVIKIRGASCKYTRWHFAWPASGDWVGQPNYLAGCRCSGLLCFWVGVGRPYLLLKLQFCPVRRIHPVCDIMIGMNYPVLWTFTSTGAFNLISYYFLQQQLCQRCNNPVCGHRLHLSLRCHGHVLHHWLQGHWEIWQLHQQVSRGRCRQIFSVNNKIISNLHKHISCNSHVFSPVTSWHY